MESVPCNPYILMEKKDILMNEKELKQNTDATIDSLSDVASEDLDQVAGGAVDRGCGFASRCGGNPLSFNADVESPAADVVLNEKAASMIEPEASKRRRCLKVFHK